MKSFVTVIYVLSSVVAIVLGAWVTYRNFPFSGESVVFLPTANTRQISRLGPEPRAPITEAGQAIVESPVYFDMRILPWFHTAHIELTYKENGQALDGIGLQIAAGWNYDLQKPDNIEVLPDGWSKATFDIKLFDGYHVRNVHRFLVSTKQTDPGKRGELLIRTLSVKTIWL